MDDRNMEGRRAARILREGADKKKTSRMTRGLYTKSGEKA